MIIGINCGHTVSGTAGCGAVGYIDESTETRRVGIKLEKLLSQSGHTVYDCTNDYAQSTSSNLAQIVDMANKQPLDLFVSIHFNAGGGRGTEVYTYGGQRHAEAVNVCNALNALGFRNRGVKDGSNLYVVKRSTAKAMLVEVCFVDNKDDVELYQEIGAENVARAICEAITGQKPDIEEKTQMKIKDINGHWAEKPIQKLIDYGIVNGDEQGNFSPDKPATKAEVAQMIAGALTICGK